MCLNLRDGDVLGLYSHCAVARLSGVQGGRNRKYDVGSALSPLIKARNNSNDLIYLSLSSHVVLVVIGVYQMWRRMRIKSACSISTHKSAGLFLTWKVLLTVGLLRTLCREEVHLQKIAHLLLAGGIIYPVGCQALQRIPLCLMLLMSAQGVK
jgi:hypothetical protein